MTEPTPQTDENVSPRTNFVVYCAGLHDALFEGSQRGGLSASNCLRMAKGLKVAIEAEAAEPVPPVLDVDALAQIIREEDGNHDLGAGALAERIVARLTAPEPDHAG